MKVSASSFRICRIFMSNAKPLFPKFSVGSIASDKMLGQRTFFSSASMDSNHNFAFNRQTSADVAKQRITLCVRNRFSTKVDHEPSSKKLKENTTCWMCSKDLTTASKFFCEYCTVILPLPQLTHFEVFDFDETFDISTTKLRKRFRDHQRLYHPDNFTLKSEDERQLSEQVSSGINSAYSTLLDPLQRGIYLLKLKGITIGEDTQLSDPEFLMEVMDLNEQIASCEESKSLVDLQRQVHDVCRKLITSISKAFQDHEKASAKTLLIKLRYYNNMSEKLKHLIPPS